MIQHLIEEIYEENLQETEKLKKDRNIKQPYIVILSTTDDEPSQRYIRNKMKKCKDNGIKVEVKYPTSMESLTWMIEVANNDPQVTGIIAQFPLASYIKNSQAIFDLISPAKDIDRLHSKFYYDKDSNNLPLTAEGLERLLQKVSSKFPYECKRVLFLGNGMTTNKRLFLHMFDKGQFDCRIANSKTPKHSVKELIDWADIIVSGIGKENSLECKGKIVISPSIIKTEDGFRSDLIEELRTANVTHKVIGSIGKLTTSNLILRAYKDAKQQSAEI